MLRHLNQLDLARRWAMSPRTLERWRWMGTGPRYLKIGKRVVYRLDDVEAFEACRLFDNTGHGSRAAGREVRGRA